MLILFLRLYFCLVHPFLLHFLLLSPPPDSPFFYPPTLSSLFTSVLRYWFYSFFSSFSYLPPPLTPPFLCKFLYLQLLTPLLFPVLSNPSSSFLSHRRLSCLLPTVLPSLFLHIFLLFFSYAFLSVFLFISLSFSSSSFASYHSLTFIIISLTLFLVPTHLYCLYHNYSFFVFNRFAHLFFLSFLSVLFFTVFPMKTSREPPTLRASFNLFACHWRLVAIIHNFLTFPRLHFPPKIVAKDRRRAGWIGPAEIVRCWSVSKDRRGKDVRTVFDQNKQRNVWLPWPGQHQEASGNR